MPALDPRGEIERQIDLVYLQNVLMDLVRIKSVNPPRGDGEKKAAEFLAGKLQELGVDCEVYEVCEGRANAVGEMTGGETGPTLVLNGHLDVVGANPEDWDSPPFHPVVKKGKIFGRGAADMKGAIAAMLAAAKLCKETGLPLGGRLLLSFVCDEEKGNLGVLDFLQRYPDLDYAVIGEPTDLGLVTAHRGAARFKVVVKGRAGHAGEPDNALNAIYLTLRIIKALQEYHRVISRRKHRILPAPTCSVTGIQGGHTDNVIPDRCEITVDRRLIPGEEIKEVEAEIKEIIGRVGQVGEDSYTLQRYVYLGPGELEPRQPFYGLVSSIYALYFGLDKVEPQGFRATCEQSLFLGSGIETVVLGPGSIAQAHQANEYVALDQLRTAAGFYYYLIQNLLGPKTA